MHSQLPPRFLVENTPHQTVATSSYTTAPIKIRNRRADATVAVRSCTHVLKAGERTSRQCTGPRCIVIWRCASVTAAVDGVTLLPTVVARNRRVVISLFMTTLALVGKALSFTHYFLSFFLSLFINILRSAAAQWWPSAIEYIREVRS